MTLYDQFELDNNKLHSWYNRTASNKGGWSYSHYHRKYTEIVVKNIRIHLNLQYKKYNKPRKILYTVYVGIDKYKFENIDSAILFFEMIAL